MPRIHAGLLTILWLAVGVACVTVVPAPGADQVRVTKKASDVTACTAVGNIKVPTDKAGGAISETEFRNEAVGFGADTALVTVAVLGNPIEGIAYRCPKG